MNEPMKQNNYTGLEIAVIGMAGKFPGARDIDRFWENLKNGIESISFFSAEELEESGFDGELIRRPGFVKAKGILEGAEYFDASFFGYTPGEADIMDPQYRVFHQCVWEALENASYDPNAYEGLIGLYAGASLNSYWIVRALLKTGASSEVIGAVSLNGLDALCMRISYKLDLRGPAVTVQSACSTSLVAIHLACQGLIIGECDMALAGGVSVTTPGKSGYLYEEGMIYSPDGHCKTFDAAGKGMNGGNGAGVVVLKRLEDAVEDKDYIYAFVKGSAINNDGSRKVGYTAASVEGQAAVIREAYRVAQVEPESIGCIEAHGTATQMGDPIEIEALKKAFNTNKKAFCAIGSVKSNLGHLDAAAGAAGFIKAVLSVKYRLIPPTLHFETPNPQIGFISSPFYVNTMLSKFKNGKYPLRVGVSSFALGGTNSHVILEEWPHEMRKSHQETQLILLSAQTPSSLEKMGQNLAKHFKENPGINLADAAYTLQVGRHVFPCRQMFVCSGVEEAVEILTPKNPNKIHTFAPTAKDRQPGSNELPHNLTGFTADYRESHQRENLLREIGNAWLQGARIDWQEHQGTQKGHRIPLPTYPFEPQSFDISVKDLLNTYSRFMEKNHEYLTEEREVPLQTAVQAEPEQPDHIAPQDDIERKITKIFRETLGMDRIGVDEDFFSLNGDSLKAITVTTRIHKELNVRIPVTELFEKPTIKKISDSIKEAVEVKFAPIEPVEAKEYYELSSVQRRLYIIQQMNPEGTVYNLPQIMLLEEEPDRQRLSMTLKKLIERHESLRTSFKITAGKPVQEIHDYAALQLEYLELDGEISDNRTAAEEAAIIRGFIRPFDLSRAPLLKAALLRVNSTRYILMLDVHHIITDGTSNEIMVKDFMSFYLEEKLSPLALQYKDYSEWQKQEKQKEIMKQQERYWKNQFKGEIPVLNMPADYPRPIIQSAEGSKIRFSLEPGEVKKLKEIAAHHRATLFMVLTAIYNIFLAKICRQEDIIIGTPIAGRRHVDLEKIIGAFINTLVLRNFPTGEKTFNTFLREVRNKTLGAFENQDYPFEDLVENVVLERDTSRNPLFAVMFILQNFEVAGKSTGWEGQGFKIKNYESEIGTSMFDMTLIGQELKDNLIFKLEYCSRLFKRETIERFITYLKNVVSSVLKNPDQEISEIEIIPEEEKNRILYGFNNTETVYPKDKVIHELFEEQVKRTPDHTALVGENFKSQIPNPKQKEHPWQISNTTGGMHLSYRELNEKSNRLACLLRKRGVKPSSIVGIMVERSQELVVGILGVMKAGGAYLPLDPGYPQERINYILEDSSTSIILSSNVLKDIHGAGYEIIDLEDTSIYNGTWSDWEHVGKSNDLVYVIYTSGSTGKPKGVMIEHRSLANFITGITAIIDFDENETVLSLTTFSFDIFGLETILPLTGGSVVVIGTREEQLEVEAAARAINEKKVTILQITPSRLSMLMASEKTAGVLESLKYLLVGGEAFSPQLLEKAREVREGKIYNLYGPTETTIWSTIKAVSNRESLNIGKPLANTRIYILNPGKRKTLQPIGIAGELCIAGDGLARGYLNKPDLTAEKFDHDLWDYQDYRDKKKNYKLQITNKEAHDELHELTRIETASNEKLLRGGQGGGFLEKSPPGCRRQKIYKTGDLARWLSDGDIEFLGRIDYQVKIRGFRIELGEIEKCLLAIDDVREAVIIDRDDENGDKYLTAYIVSAKSFEVSELKHILSRSLPGYMIPSFIVSLETIPLTPNGKIDRNALPKPRLGEIKEFTPPADVVEEKLVEIWSRVLGEERDRISTGVSFFDLGGHSLNAVVMSSQIHKEFDMNISLGEIFNTDTINGIAALIKAVDWVDSGRVNADSGQNIKEIML